VLREARPSELKTIQKMHKDKLFEHGLDSKVKLSEPKVFIAVSQGSLVGFCKLGQQASSKAGFILRIEVLEKFQKGGVGKKLIATAHNHFRGKGITLVNTMAVRNAIAFFSKSGYKAKHVFGGGKPKDMVAEMTKTIRKKRRLR